MKNLEDLTGHIFRSFKVLWIRLLFYPKLREYGQKNDLSALLGWRQLAFTLEKAIITSS